MPTPSLIHSAAQRGYSRASQEYVKGRPGYPAAVGSWLRDVEGAGLGPGKLGLDLGAGTGKFLPLLLETGATITAVEPVAAMRGELRRQFPGLSVHEGRAEAIPLPSSSQDAVLCAQAFHWFANAGALEEIARVLKPGGRLGLVWNMRDERSPSVAALGAIVNAHEGSAPRFHSGAWRSVFPHRCFGPLEERQFTQEHRGEVEDVVRNRVRSTSFIAALAPEERARVEAQVEALIAATPEWHRGGEVVMPYVTHVFSAVVRKG